MSGILGATIGSYAAGGVTLEYVTVVKGTSSLTIPSTGVQAGDIAILTTSAYGFGSITKVFDSQFTEVLDSSLNASTSVRMVSGYRTLTAGDLGRTVTGMNTTEEHIFLLVFRPTGNITSISAVNVNGQATASNPSAQTLSLGSYSDTRIGVSFMSSSGIISPRTISPAGSMTEIVGNNTDFYGHYVIYNKGDAGTESTISVDMDDEGYNVMQSWILLVS